MGKSSKIKVTDYHMNLVYGICASSDLLRFRQIRYGEKPIYTNPDWTNDLNNINHRWYNNPDLFGGNLREGGLRGNIIMHNRGIDRGVVASGFADSLQNTPGLPHIASMAFIGERVTNYSSSFLWSTNAPALKQIDVTVTSFPDTPIGGTYVPNYPGFGPWVFIGDDVNPAYIIWDALTSNSHGAGLKPASGVTWNPSGDVDGSSFVDAAASLDSENFGLSTLWTRQSSVDDFVKDVLNHIDGVLRVNMETGWLELKLLRNDYDPDTLFEFNESNCRVEDFQRKTWGEIASEVVVTYTHPESFEDAKVSVVDSAAEATQGMVSTSINFHMVRQHELAARLASRELKKAAYPLSTVRIAANRMAHAVYTGDCVKLHYPSRGIVNMILRVSNVDYGTQGDSVIRLECVEDVYSLKDTEYGIPVPAPSDPIYISPETIDEYYFFTAPYFLIAQGDEDFAEGLESASAVLGAFAFTDINPPFKYSFVQEEYNSVEEQVEWVEYGDRDFVFKFDRPSALIQESRSVMDIPAGDIPANYPFGTGALLWFGPLKLGTTTHTLDETTHEIARVASVENIPGDLLRVTIDRGVLDTTPKVWDSPTQLRVFAFPPSSDTLLFEEKVYGEVSELRLKMVTNLGSIVPEELPVIQAGQMSLRVARPYRPANIAVGGTMFGTYNHGASLLPIFVQWSNRSRVSEIHNILAWDDDTNAAEDGQTSVVRLFDATWHVIYQSGPINPDLGVGRQYWEIPTEITDPLTEFHVTVESQTEFGGTSLQRHSVHVIKDVTVRD